mgnify:CR=1 FL=1
MLKKILSNTIVRLILAVLIGLLVGLVVNEPVLKAVMIVKQITGQIIFFLVPLIILGFVAPSIARLKSNASKVLLFAFSIAVIGWRRYLWRRCGLRVNTAFAYSNRLGRSKRHPSHVV